MLMGRKIFRKPRNLNTFEIERILIVVYNIIKGFSWSVNECERMRAYNIKYNGFNIQCQREME